MPPVGDTQGPRKVERSASMALETPAGDFERTTDAVNGVVARFGGMVASSQIGESEVAGGEATFERPIERRFGNGVMYLRYRIAG